MKEQERIQVGDKVKLIFQDEQYVVQCRYPTQKDHPTKLRGRYPIYRLLDLEGNTFGDVTHEIIELVE